MKASDAPRLEGWSGLPSIFVGRYMWDSTRTPVAKPLSGIALAKKIGLPGMRFSGWRTYGTILSAGEVQAGRPPRATQAPIKLRKTRRATTLAGRAARRGEPRSK